MDFAFFRFITEMDENVKNILKHTRSLLRTMSALASRVAAVFQYLQSEKAGLMAELAATKEALALALADDAADDETIAAAQAAAAAAQAAADAATAKVVELEALVAADVEEDAAISAILDSVQLPEPPAPVEPEPTPEPAPVEPSPEPSPEEGEPVEPVFD